MMSTVEKMLINATQPEEVRVALVKNNKLYDLDVESLAEAKKKGNIYKATVTRREPSLDAVFVEYGSKRQGFLPLKEISPEYFVKKLKEDEKLPITTLIKEGQELLIQVDKEERGTKGAALTTYITLAGSYLVLMPNSPKSGGISRRIEGEAREELKEALQSLKLPEDMGVIIRTAGVGKGLEELQSDLDMLLNQWHAIKAAQNTSLAPALIHQEGDVVIRAIRDNLRKTIDEIIIDDSNAYVKAKQYIEKIKPEFSKHLSLYKDQTPLFTLYQIDSQIETAHQRQVILPSGGSLVIDRTEALVAIDINSSKATGGGDIEATAFNTNLEAADEIARQLRLRDLGGLVVIDFIDMSSTKNQRDVENRLKEAVKADRARIQLGRISRFGLLEMSRQRLRLSLGETAMEPCPRCEGRGHVRHIQSRGLDITRLIEEESLKNNVSEIHVQLPPDMATYLMNEKRGTIQSIEKRHQIAVMIIANPHMESPKYSINSVKGDTKSKQSYELLDTPEVNVTRDKPLPTPDEPVVKGFHESIQPQDVNILTRVWRALFGETEVAVEPPKPARKNASSNNRRRPQNRRRSPNKNTASKPKTHRASNKPQAKTAAKKTNKSSSSNTAKKTKKQTENT